MRSMSRKLPKNRLSPAQGGQSLSTIGPRKVARAAVAFNAMQRRIQEQLTERMHVLAQSRTTCNCPPHGCACLPTGWTTND
jgi:hypothetical protein